MIKAKKKSDAFALFLEGHSLRAVAEITGISKSTVMRWSSQEEWVKQRESHQEDILIAFKEAHLTSQIKRSTLISDKMNRLLNDYLADLMATNRGVIQKRKYKISPVQMCRMASLCLDLGIKEAELIAANQKLHALTVS